MLCRDGPMQTRKSIHLVGMASWDDYTDMSNDCISTFAFQQA